MGLREEAIGEYEKEQESIKDSNIIESEKFAEKSLKVLRDIIGDNHSGMIVVADKQSGSTSFIVDRILFRVTIPVGLSLESLPRSLPPPPLRPPPQKPRQPPVVNVVQTCERCGIEIISTVKNLKDIGKALIETHSKYDCDKKKLDDDKNEDDKNEKLSNVEKKLLVALRDFVQENDHMCSSF